MASGSSVDMSHVTAGLTRMYTCLSDLLELYKITRVGSVESKLKPRTELCTSQESVKEKHSRRM